MRTIGIVLAALGVLGILNVLRSYGVYLSWWWFEELFYPTGLALGGVGLLLGSRSMQRRAVGSTSTSPAPGSAAPSPSPSSRRPPRSPSARPRRISS